MERAHHENPETAQAEGQSSFPDMRLVARRCLRTQFWVALVLSAALLWQGPVAAYSAFLGGVAAIVPALLFAMVILRRVGRDSGAFLRAAVVGEAVKLAATIVLCIAVFMLVEPLIAGWFIGGLVLTILAGYVGLIFAQ
ncbi:MAG: ATP synthase subunit I [Xanthomonadales bacterium]|nr:ATP synthase subunit I [Xanthomonadales bacterium]